MMLNFFIFFFLRLNAELINVHFPNGETDGALDFPGSRNMTSWHQFRKGGVAAQTGARRKRGELAEHPALMDLDDLH